MISKPISATGSSAHAPPLRPATFRRFQELIRERIGIFLGPPKVQLLTSRLAKRLRARDCSDFESYLDLVLSDDHVAGEFQEMVNRITTNKTDFFREEHHFRFLRENVIDLMQAEGGGAPRIWSAGCSTGEEPYSIAMVLAEALPPRVLRDAFVRASDIDTDVLERAGQGVFSLNRLARLDKSRWQPWFLRGKGRQEGLVKAREALRSMIQFHHHNLVGARWPEERSFDAIFCRNTLIYFDRPTQLAVVQRLARCLRDGGTLFLGHSENLLGDVPELTQIGQTTFQRLAGSMSSRKASGLSERPFDARVFAGGMFCSSRPAQVRTLLGSCVAACLYDPVARIGGMNHFLLPEGRLEGTGRALAYGVHAMESLVNEIMQRGGERRRIQAKLFGGASVLTDFEGGRRVAERNRAFAMRYLEAEGIKLAAHKLGGDRPLAVRFETHTGRAFVREAGRDRQEVTATREVEYFRQVSKLTRDVPGAEATLFQGDAACPKQSDIEDDHE